MFPSCQCFVLLVTVALNMWTHSVLVVCWVFSPRFNSLYFCFYSSLISLFPCMQSRFIQIKYCSNILIIPELLSVGFFFSVCASRRFLSLLCCLHDVRTNVFVCRVLWDSLWVAMLACLVCRIASLNGFIYKFVIHYSWNQKRPSTCKQICLPQVSGFKD